MPHTHSDLIEVKRVRGKGRGVFARESISKGSVIERVPLIELPVDDVFGGNQDTKLANYVFKWEKNTVVIALGYGSLYNHSFRPNARFYNKGHLTQVFEAVRNIEAGEEITINYNGNPKDKTEMHFDVLDK